MSQPIKIGLTGSIGMGKSTTAEMFRDEGAAVWDADQAVHRLYQRGGAGVTEIQAIAPEAVVNGSVDRNVLKRLILKDQELLRKIEKRIHPLVAADRRQFLQTTAASIVVLDVPLLFETGTPSDYDYVAVVSAPASLQRDRVLEREGMTEDVFQSILQRQLPDKEKRMKADFIVETDTFENARRQVAEIMETVRLGAGA